MNGLSRVSILVVIALYLFSYELGFRGYLLFPCAETLGVWPAVAVSTALYAALHMPKGAVEALGCVPAGIAFSVAALHTGTIWVPFIGHFLSAVVNDIIMLEAGRR